MDQDKTAVILGIPCRVTRVKCGDGRYRDVYSFTVPGWAPCSVTGLAAARRVINARLSPAVQWLRGKE